ncbi:MAG TPA: sulfocyanin-like copper-binding protein [Candidatus Thermoplasmatota archaeon]|nr:sulfocyanin-like copper-binding protein [Candidatus Thermoplasmatota archaeon]
MRRWLFVTLLVVASLLVVYAAYSLFVSYDNGSKVTVTIHAGVHADGPNAGKMYYRCSNDSPDGAANDSDQCIVTVHKRNKVTFTVISDDGAGRKHDFKLLGAPYLVYPAGIEMEIQDSNSQTGTFTAWATGDYKFICELSGHEAAGMWGTLHVID